MLPPIPQLTPPQLTVRQCNLSALRTVETVLAESKNTFNAVWHNTAHAPEEAISVMGTAAADFFALHAATAQYLAVVCPRVGLEFVPFTLPPGDLVFSEDGSATFTPAPAEEEGGGE